MQRIGMVMVGIGGFGECYLRAIDAMADGYGVEVIAGVDPRAASAPYGAILAARRVPVYPTLEECLARHRPELVSIASPIHEHGPQTCLALRHGAHVLCEKPAGARVEDVAAMIAARDAAGKLVAIGYQGSFTRPALALKADLIAGRYGRPLRLAELGIGRRDEAYYRRNDWAGMQRASSGAWVLDSPLNNAFSHCLHEMLWLLGDRIERATAVATVQAELYRANPTIDNYDTGVVRAITPAGVEILFATSHSVDDSANAHRTRFVFERATIAQEGGGYVARLEDGSTVAYRDDQPEEFAKLRTVVEAIAGRGVIPCGLEAAGVHTAVIEAAQRSPEAIVALPADQVVVTGAPGARRWIGRGIAETLGRGFEEHRLPSELGAAWARPSRVVDLRAASRAP